MRIDGRERAAAPIGARFGCGRTRENVIGLRVAGPFSAPPQNADTDRIQARKMAKKGEKKVGRTLQLKFTLPTAEPDRLMALIKAAKPYYELFGGKQVRLLQNVDHPAQFIQIIDYEIDKSFETSRQEIAGDPRLQAFLQAWRAMFPGTVEVDIFREIDE
jgi:hypothetical protein